MQDSGHRPEQANRPGDLVFDVVADFFFWPDTAAEDEVAVVGGGLSGFFPLFPSFDAVLSPIRLIVYGSSSELAHVTPNACLFFGSKPYK